MAEGSKSQGGFAKGRWLALVGSMWLLACAGNSYNFAIYSPTIKDVLGYNQQAITTLGVAKDVGDNVGLLAGLLADMVPPWLVIAVGTVLGFVGYGGLWLVLSQRIAAPPFWQVWCLLCCATNGSIYFITAGLVSSQLNFPQSGGVVAGIVVGFIGLSGAIYAQVYSALLAPNPPAFLLLACIGPAAIGVLSLFLVRIFPPPPRTPKTAAEESASFSLILRLCFLLAAFLLFVISAQAVTTFSPSTTTAVTITMLLLLLSPASVLLLSPFSSSRPTETAAQSDPALTQPLLLESSPATSAPDTAACTASPVAGALPPIREGETLQGANAGIPSSPPPAGALPYPHLALSPAAANSTLSHSPLSHSPKAHSAAQNIATSLTRGSGAPFFVSPIRSGGQAELGLSSSITAAAQASSFGSAGSATLMQLLLGTSVESRTNRSGSGSQPRSGVLDISSPPGGGRQQAGSRSGSVGCSTGRMRNGKGTGMEEGQNSVGSGGAGGSANQGPVTNWMPPRGSQRSLNSLTEDGDVADETDRGGGEAEGGEGNDDWSYYFGEEEMSVHGKNKARGSGIPSPKSGGCSTSNHEEDNEEDEDEEGGAESEEGEDNETETDMAAAESEERGQEGEGRVYLGQDHSFGQALSTVDFWLLYGGLVCGFGAGLTAITNLAQIGEAQGYGNAQVLTSLVSIWQFLGRLASGSLSEHFVRKHGMPRPIALAAIQLLMAVGHMAFALAPPGGVYLGSLLIGFTYGGLCSVMPVIAAELFGKRCLGLLYNSLLAAAPVGSYLFSGVLAGYLYEIEARKDRGMTAGLVWLGDAGKWASNATGVPSLTSSLTAGVTASVTAGQMTGSSTFLGVRKALGAQQVGQGWLGHSWFGRSWFGQGVREWVLARGHASALSPLPLLMEAQAGLTVSPASGGGGAGGDGPKSCHGAHCFRLIFLILTVVCLVGAAVNVFVASRTARVYGLMKQIDVGAEEEEDKDADLKDNAQ